LEFKNLQFLTAFLVYREMIDPTPDIHALLLRFNNRFFQGLLNCVELEWCSKMFSCAGICYWTRNQMGSACVIRLSEPLLKLRPRKDLVETLLHEMIHAYNFIRGIKEENGGHGQNFLEKMYEINRLAGTNISVYHNFLDEVDLYKVHYWRCDGACQNRSPYYGFVKKAENIAPSVEDKWWTRHVESCNGQFVKVKGPEISGKADPVIPIPRSSSTNIVQTIDLTGKNEIITKTTETKKTSTISDVIVIDDSFKEISPPSRKSLHTTIRKELDDDEIIFIIDDEFDDNISQPKFFIPSPRHKCHCPICNVELVSEKVNEHLDQCLGI
jgi:SprT-like family